MSTVALPPRYRGSHRERSVPRVGLFVAAGSLLTGLIAGELVAGGHSIAVAALAAILLPVLMWKRPELGPTILLVGALAVEQFGYTVGPRAGAATAQIPLFHGLGGLHINPADILVALLFGIYLAKRDAVLAAPPRTPQRIAMLTLLGVVVFGVVVGQIHGGQLRIAFTETRPYFYLVVTYMLASALITTRAAVRAVLWGLVATIGFKAGQGLLIFLSVRHLSIPPDAVLAHEEALFFSAFLLFVLALWLFEVPGPLRTTATVLAPLVVAGDLANSRRTAWLVLGAGLIALLAVAFAVLPTRRRVVRRIMLVIAVASAVYLPAFWNKTGGLAQPARAIHSAVAPSPRDASSDLYRIQEDANLLLNIRNGGPLGLGFGVPIDYALPIVDISDIDPFIAYIPHNGVLYLFMRMGVLGAVAFWAVLGIGILGACRLARSRDRELGAIGALTVAVLVAYAFEGHTDQGFFLYRVAFTVGTLLGLAEAARRMSAQIPAAAAPMPARVRAPRPVGRPKLRGPAAPLLPETELPAAATATNGAAGEHAAEPRRARTPRERGAQIAASAALPAASAFFVWLFVTGGPHTTRMVTVRQTSPPATIAHKAAAPAPAPTRVVVTGLDQGSWLQIRRDSAVGQVLYEGVLAGGSSRAFQARRLWIRFGAAANLIVTLNGKLVPLHGAGERLFTGKGG